MNYLYELTLRAIVTYYDAKRLDMFPHPFAAVYRKDFMPFLGNPENPDVMRYFIVLVITSYIGQLEGIEQVKSCDGSIQTLSLLLYLAHKDKVKDSEFHEIFTRISKVQVVIAISTNSELHQINQELTDALIDELMIYFRIVRLGGTLEVALDLIAHHEINSINHKELEQIGKIELRSRCIILMGFISMVGRIHGTWEPPRAPVDTRTSIQIQDDLIETLCQKNSLQTIKKLCEIFKTCVTINVPLACPILD